MQSNARPSVEMEKEWRWSFFDFSSCRSLSEAKVNAVRTTAFISGSLAVPESSLSSDGLVFRPIAVNTTIGKEASCSPAEPVQEVPHGKIATFDEKSSVNEVGI